MNPILKIILVSITILFAAIWSYYGFANLKQNPFSVQERPMEQKNPVPKKLLLTKEEWAKRLSPAQYHVLREKGTEPAFSNEYVHTKEDGVYQCAACALPLFSSQAKYDSGTGWPSFWEPIRPQNIQYEEDYSFFTKRVEVLCARCESHIGHVFEDGPPPTGLRYCVNSLALKFIPKQKR